MHGPRWLPMASDSPIGGHEAREPCDHPRAMEGHRRPSGAIHGSHYFQCRIGIVFIVNMEYFSNWDPAPGNFATKLIEFFAGETIQQNQF